MQQVNRRSRSRIAIAAVLIVLIEGAARASGPGVVISQQIDISVYQHYLEDLLFTHLGQSRGLGSPQHGLARTNIVNTLQTFGLTVALEPFVYNAVTYYNVVATQPGTNNGAQTIVVGAHFDSVNAGPGADDNGTGTALVMEVARVLSQHRSSRRIRYVLFDREEQGRRGSIAYVAAHAADNTVMAVTADMVGHDSGAYGMDLYSKTTSSTVTNGVASAIATYGNGLHSFLNFGNYTFSDHWSFENVGIPAVVIIERCYTCNTYYHTANDAVDVSSTYINYNMVADLVRSVTGYLVDTGPVSLWGDRDNDGDVDDADFAQFRNSFGGPAAPNAWAFDKNLDGVIDCSDWPAFRSAYTASSGHVPLIEMESFIAALVDTNTSPADLCISHINADTVVDGLDVLAYVNAALGP